MKRLVALAVLATAVFSAIPASATCTADPTTPRQVCVEPDGNYEVCAWAADTSGPSTMSCLDTDGDADHDLSVEDSRGDDHSGVWLSDGSFRMSSDWSLRVGPVCLYVRADTATQTLQVRPIFCGGGPPRPPHTGR